ncbi:MAG: FecR domain-containing protein [Proteobacteria bacterium]|nr:FecR domain-containing protein [Pseudomonadota bacterium]
MSKIVNINDSEEINRATIEAEASAWVVQLQDAQPTQEDIQAFQHWLRKSPLHRQIFKEFAGTWNDMDVLSDLVFPVSEQNSSPAKVRYPAIVSMFGMFQFRYAMASLSLFVVLITFFAVWQYSPNHLVQQQFTAQYNTEIGELKQVFLPDGSEILLNTKSTTNVAYKEDVRIIHLVKGEAHFNVFHDSTKPFIVYAGKVLIEAVGTAFTVYRKQNSVDVIVTEGQVKVAVLRKAPGITAESGLELLEKADTITSIIEGQRAVFKDKIELVEKIELEEIEKKLSWQNGMLIFDADRLEDVVAEINRYTPKKIMILDASIRDLKIGGYFKVRDIDLILDTLEAIFNIKVNEVSENLIYLSKK